jgi:hypothetical protein
MINILGNMVAPTPVPIPSYPIGLRWEIFLPLFAMIILLEAITLAFFLRSRWRVPWLTLIANAITSCLLAPSVAQWMGWAWDDYPLMLAAYNVRKALQNGTNVWIVIYLAFLALFFLFGTSTSLVEGAIVQYFSGESPSKSWGGVALANLISYFFLTLWSSYIGYRMKDMDSEEATDYVFKHILFRPSENGYADFKWLGWLLFALAILICLLIMIFGNWLNRQPGNYQKRYFHSITFNDITLDFSLLYFFAYNIIRNPIGFALLFNGILLVALFYAPVWGEDREYRQLKTGSIGNY